MWGQVYTALFLGIVYFTQKWGTMMPRWVAETAAIDANSGGPFSIQLSSIRLNWALNFVSASSSLCTS